MGHRACLLLPVSFVLKQYNKTEINFDYIQLIDVGSDLPYKSVNSNARNMWKGGMSISGFWG